MLRPEAINTRLQAFDAMDIKIKMYVTMCSEIGEQTLPCGGEESRSCGKEIDSRPPLKSRAERRERTTAPKPWFVETGGGRLTSPRPDTFGSPREGMVDSVLSFVAE